MGSAGAKLRRRKTTADDDIEEKVNHALVFIKPHACNPLVETFVKEFLVKHKVHVDRREKKQEKSLRKLIDVHYGTISQAAMEPPETIAVSDEEKEKFRDAFGEDWDEVVKSRRVLNVKTFPKVLSRSVGEAWEHHSTEKVGIAQGVKIGRVKSIHSETEKEEIHFLVNGFYQDMRDQYCRRDSKVICFKVHFREADLSWAKFRQEVIGSTNPTAAKEGSLRQQILQRYKDLGLSEEPSYSNNGVHASAGPVEGLYERLLWFGTKLEDDPFGSALLDANVDPDVIEWFLQNKEITLFGRTDTTFNFTEELDSSEVIRHALNLQNELPEMVL